MLLIECPWCGCRDEIEFAYGGESGLTPPAINCSDKDWADYLYMRTNTRGIYRERWNHASGCRQWFEVVRDTTTNAVIETFKPRFSETKETGKVA